MEQIQPINFIDIKDDSNYLMMLVPYSRYGGNEEEMYKGTGAQVKEKLKEVFETEEESPTWDSFASYLEDANGDGEDYVEVFLV